MTHSYTKLYPGWHAETNLVSAFNRFTIYSSNSCSTDRTAQIFRVVIAPYLLEITWYLYMQSLVFSHWD